MCAYFFPAEIRPCECLFGTVRLLLFDLSNSICVFCLFIGQISTSFLTQFCVLNQLLLCSLQNFLIFFQFYFIKCQGKNLTVCVFLCYYKFSILCTNLGLCVNFLKLNLRPCALIWNRASIWHSRVVDNS